MAQFDVHQTRGNAAPYLVVLQSDAVGRLDTVIVAPAWRLDANDAPIRKLQPTVKIAGVAHVLSMQEMLSIPIRALGPLVASLKTSRAEIIAAIDLLFAGY